MNQQTKSSPVEEPSTTAVLDTNGTTHPTNDEIHSADSADTRSRVILNAMVAFRDGNFSVRMPSDWSGIDGRIAEAFNQTIDHEDRMFREVNRLSITVGKEGRLKQRMSLAGAVGDWAVKGQAINALIDDLVRPTADVARTIGAASTITTARGRSG